MSLFAFAPAFAFALASLDKFAGLGRLRGTGTACMPGHTTDFASVDASVRLCTGVRTSRSVGINDCACPPAEVEAYVVSILAAAKGTPRERLP